MKHKKRPLPVALLLGCMVTGIALALWYFATFSDCLDGSCGSYVLPYNTDHFIYETVIENLSDSPWWLPFVGNYGVAMLYHYLLMPLTGTSVAQLPALSMVVDLALYAGSLVAFVRLCRRLGVRDTWVLVLAFYPPFIFFSAYINKDMLLIFLLLQVTLAMMDRRLGWIIVLTLLLTLVRAQYVALPLLALFLAGGRFPRRFWAAYIVTSIGAALIARFSGFFELGGRSSGITDLIYELNRQYLAGSLLFNPVRTVQYPLALAQSLTLVNADNGTDLMKLNEGVSFFWFALIAPGVIGFYRRAGLPGVHHGAHVLRAVVTSFMLILLLTSITEPRYLMSLFPLLLLMALASGRLPKPAAPRRRPRSVDRRSVPCPPGTGAIA